MTLLHHLEQSGRTHAAADAHCHDSELRLAATPLDQRVTGQPRAGHAVGMADRNRAAIDIDLFRIDPEPVTAIDHLHRESLVELPEIDIVDLQTVALQEPRHREHRPDAHLVRLAAMGDETSENT